MSALGLVPGHRAYLSLWLLPELGAFLLKVERENRDALLGAVGSPGAAGFPGATRSPGAAWSPGAG